MGGMVLETNMSEIMLRIEEQGKIEKEEVTTDEDWTIQSLYCYFNLQRKDFLV